MKYAIGVDFGTESGRGVRVEVATEEERANSLHQYTKSVDETLPALT